MTIKLSNGVVDDLTAALKPFAAVAEHDIGSDEHDSDKFQPARAHNRAPMITVGDLRRALAVTHSHGTSTPAMSAETVPSEEFVLVPREPTEAMIDAADRIRPLPPHYLSEAYRAMIAAAPAPNPSPAAKGGEGGAVPTLLSCPFCGGAPTLHPHSPDRMLGAWVSCSTCGLESPTETGQSVEAAVQHWNTRAALAAPSPQPVGNSEAEAVEQVIREWGEGPCDSLEDLIGMVRGALTAQDELAEIRAELLAGQGDDDGLQILPDFEEGQTVLQMVCKCIALLETRRDVVEAVTVPAPSPQPADAVRERIARALNSVLGSEEDEHPRHHPAQNSWEKPSEVWWTQWLEAADAVVAALASDPAPAGEAVEPVAWRWRMAADRVWNYQEDRQRIPDAIHEALYAHPAPEDTARLREELERDGAQAVLDGHHAEHGETPSMTASRARVAERERDDSRKALETATDDRERLVEAVSTFLGKGEHRDAVSCHYCGDTHGGNRCRSGGDHDFDPTGETIWEFEGKDVDTLRAALATEASR